MSYIAAIFIVGIICITIYGLFELFARRRERIAIIEKLGEGKTFGQIEGKFKLSFGKSYSFMALRGACLMLGLGLGLLVGIALSYEMLGGTGDMNYTTREAQGVIYGGSVLLCGGLGLLVAFLLEITCLKKKMED